MFISAVEVCVCEAYGRESRRVASQIACISGYIVTQRKFRRPTEKVTTSNAQIFLNFVSDRLAQLYDSICYEVKCRMMYR